jgi:hypothetical protein
MITESDRIIIRELAKQVRDLAADDVNQERIKRIREMHNLKTVRPPVWIEEIPWHEMDINGELIIHCETKAGQEMEWYFRCTLYRWKHIQADMVGAQDSRVVLRPLRRDNCCNGRSCKV